MDFLSSRGGGGASNFCPFPVAQENSPLLPLLFPALALFQLLALAALHWLLARLGVLRCRKMEPDPRDPLVMPWEYTPGSNYVARKQLLGPVFHAAAYRTQRRMLPSQSALAQSQF